MKLLKSISASSTHKHSKFRNQQSHKQIPLSKFTTDTEVPFVPPKRSPKKFIRRSETKPVKKSTVSEPSGKGHYLHNEFPETTEEELGDHVGRLPQEAPLSWFQQFCGQPKDSETKPVPPTQHLVSVRAAGL
jgi:hypothetical protein